jgi:hypothetical protein
VYRGSSLGSLTREADGPAGTATLLTTGGTYLIAVEGVGGTTVDVTHTPGEVAFSTTGSTFTTDTEQPFDGPTPADPVETAIIGPAGTPKSIFETQGATAASAWTFPGWKVEISAPPLQPPGRYSITFRVDGSLLAGLSPQQELDVFRNGVAVPSCIPAPAPDPCVASRSRSAGDRIVTVSTSRASTWTFGSPRTTRGTALGLLQPGNGGDAEFLVASNGSTLTAGALSYGFGAERFVALSVHALAIDGNAAWIAGVGRDARPFLAYVEDNGAGSADRFRLWIAGVERTPPDGRLRTGNVVVRT